MQGHAGQRVQGRGAHSRLAVDVELGLCGFGVAEELQGKLAAPHAVGKCDERGAPGEAVADALQAEAPHLATEFPLHAVEHLLQLRHRVPVRVLVAAHMTAPSHGPPRTSTTLPVAAVDPCAVGCASACRVAPHCVATRLVTRPLRTCVACICMRRFTECGGRRWTTTGPRESSFPSTEPTEASPPAHSRAHDVHAGSDKAHMHIQHAQSGGAPDVGVHGGALAHDADAGEGGHAHGAA